MLWARPTTTSAGETETTLVSNVAINGFGRNDFPRPEPVSATERWTVEVHLTISRCPCTKGGLSVTGPGMGSEELARPTARGQV